MDVSRNHQLQTYPNITTFTADLAPPNRFEPKHSDCRWPAALRKLCRSFAFLCFFWGDLWGVIKFKTNTYKYNNKFHQVPIGSGQTVVIEPHRGEEKTRQVCQCPSEFGVCILTAVGAACYDWLSSLQSQCQEQVPHCFKASQAMLEQIAEFLFYIHIGFEDRQVHASTIHSSTRTRKPW